MWFVHVFDIKNLLFTCMWRLFTWCDELFVMGQMCFWYQEFVFDVTVAGHHTNSKAATKTHKSETTWVSKDNKECKGADWLKVIWGFIFCLFALYHFQ